MHNVNGDVVFKTGDVYLEDKNDSHGEEKLRKLHREALNIEITCCKKMILLFCSGSGAKNVCTPIINMLKMKSSNKELSEAEAIFFLWLTIEHISLRRIVHNDCRSTDLQGLITVIPAFFFY